MTDGPWPSRWPLPKIAFQTKFKWSYENFSDERHGSMFEAILKKDDQTKKDGRGSVFHQPWSSQLVDSTLANDTEKVLASSSRQEGILIMCTTGYKGKDSYRTGTAITMWYRAGNEMTMNWCHTVRYVLYNRLFRWLITCGTGTNSEHWALSTKALS